jgi:hypothetical protein
VQASGEPRFHANQPDDSAALALHLRPSHEAARLETWTERLESKQAEKAKHKSRLGKLATTRETAFARLVVERRV